MENRVDFIQLTTLNTLFTGTLLFALLYDPQRVQSLLPATLQKISTSSRGLTWLKSILVVSFLRNINYFLSDQVLNNWKSDAWKNGEEIVLITGGSSGIGERLVSALSKSSKAVLVLDLQPPKALPSNAFFYKADITNSAEIAAAATKISFEHGDPSVLINNAGVASWNSILQEPEEIIRHTFNVNTISHFLVVKQFLPAMIHKNHGHVVTMASLASFAVNAKNVDYSCTKASALAFHEGLTSELKTTYGADKVRTTVVHPSWVRTPLIQKLSQHPKWKAPTMEPETVVDAVVTQLLSGKSGHLILPAWLSFVSGIRGFPLWLQYSLRNRTAKLLEIAEDL